MQDLVESILENGILTIPQWCAFKLPEIVGGFRPEKWAGSLA